MSVLRDTLIRFGESEAARLLVTRSPLRALSRRFVPGERIEDLMRSIQQAQADGMSCTCNYLGEAVQEAAQASRAAGVYVRVLERMHEQRIKGNVSLKLTQLGEGVSDKCLGENLTRVLHTADSVGAFVRLDMESSAHTRRTLDALERLWARGYRNIGVALQAYLRRTPGDVERMIQLGARVRLCKGAYAEPESVALQERDEIRQNFSKLTRRLLSEGHYPAIATHDEAMVDVTLDHASRESIPPDAFEFQMLHGVRRDLQRELVADGWRVRVYVPFGKHWYPYLMRRLAERPSNLLFFAGSLARESLLGFRRGDRRSRRRGR